MDPRDASAPKNDLSTLLLLQKLFMHFFVTKEFAHTFFCRENDLRVFFVAKTIYALRPDSFCTLKVAIRKVQTFWASALTWPWLYFSEKWIQSEFTFKPHIIISAVVVHFERHSEVLLRIAIVVQTSKSKVTRLLMEIVFSKMFSFLEAKGLGATASHKRDCLWLRWHKIQHILHIS